MDHNLHLLHLAKSGNLIKLGRRQYHKSVGTAMVVDWLDYVEGDPLILPDGFVSWVEPSDEVATTATTVTTVKPKWQHITLNHSILSRYATTTYRTTTSSKSAGKFLQPEQRQADGGYWE